MSSTTETLPTVATALLDRAGRTSRFAEWRYGLFVHWGVYSLLGRGEWVRFHDRISGEEYRNIARRFQPTQFDASRLARLARESGMKYAVLTAKHHDGYCLFDSAYTDLTSSRLCGRDFVAEWCEALRAEGIAVGLYLSVKDWDVPEYFTVRDPQRNRADWERCIERFHQHAIELATNYGPLDLMWFDGGDDADFAGRFGGRYDEIWRSADLLAELARLQPTMLLNDRSGVGGDFRTPEQEVPHGYSGTQPFESCLTLTEGAWGYSDSEYDELKTPRSIALALTSVAARGGNLLLNVGPDAEGRVPEAQARTLREVGRWIAQEAGVALYGLHPSLPAYWDYTSSARIVLGNDKLLFVVLTSWHKDGCTVVGQFNGKISRVQLVAQPQLELSVAQNELGLIKISGLPQQAPSRLPAVLRLEFYTPYSLRTIPQL
jgi:alpha-L-fucosidase